MNKKKLFIILGCISLILTFSFIGDSYAKYITKIDNNASMKIARWKILVNNKDILDETESLGEITPTVVSNSNVKNGFVAPTSQAYFILDIDGSNSDVSFNYDVSVSPKEDNPVSDIRIIKCTLLGPAGATSDIPMTNVGGVNHAIGDVLQTDTSKVRQLKFELEWYDGYDNNMNNQEDTEAAGKDVTFNINAKFTQKND